jgi:ABC-type Fe3+-hydroxamate transport system substrate-binding protein
LLAFRESRETLLADWLREKPQRPAKPKPSVVDRRAERAAELLAAWERRLKMAKTKVSKYRRKVNYYGAVAARRQG